LEIVVKKIIIIATLDNRDQEVSYLKELILRWRQQPLIIDIGFRGEPRLAADITADEVAKAAGAKIEKLRDAQGRKRANELMIKGAIAKLDALCRAGEVSGMVAIGGMTTLVMASSIMREMPYQIPKLIVSSAASMPGVNRLFGPTGITLMHSLIDIRGLNSLLKAQLSRAAAAICGMVEAEIPPPYPEKGKPRIAMTTYGYIDNCARYIRESLGEKYEFIGFHATGMPEVAMEKLIEEGFFSGVIDLVPSSITNEKFSGSRLSWSRRLEVAGEKGLPQVVAPAGVDTISRTGLTAEELAPELKVRKHYFMDLQRVTMFLNREELGNVASVYAEKLNRAIGPTKFLIPKRGWLSIEKEGGEFYSPQGIQSFVDGLREKLKPEIEIREVDANIDEPVFAQEVVAAFEEVMKLKDAG
jgi:uncharacterized protein (UPF0261 family)